MFLLVLADHCCRGQNPESHKTVVCVCVNAFWAFSAITYCFAMFTLCLCNEVVKCLFTVLEVYQFARDAAVAESWLLAHEPYLQSTDIGVSMLL